MFALVISFRPPLDQSLCPRPSDVTLEARGKDTMWFSVRGGAKTYNGTTNRPL